MPSISDLKGEVYYGQHFFETVPIELDVLAAASRIALKYIEFIYIPITIFVSIPVVAVFVFPQ